MKAASVSDIKKELKGMTLPQLEALCLRLARFKKDNKELLTYLLFEADDEAAYIESIKSEMEEAFLGLNVHNLYFTKKGLRKILRTTNKFAKYSSSKATEVELLIYFCTQLKELKLTGRSHALLNLYEAQIKKIETAVAALHEDLQHDYKVPLQKLKRKD